MDTVTQDVGTCAVVRVDSHEHTVDKSWHTRAWHVQSVSIRSTFGDNELLIRQSRRVCINSTGLSHAMDMSYRQPHAMCCILISQSSVRHVVFAMSQSVDVISWWPDHPQSMHGDDCIPHDSLVSFVIHTHNCDCPIRVSTYLFSNLGTAKWNFSDTLFLRCFWDVSEINLSQKVIISIPAGVLKQNVDFFFLRCFWDVFWDVSEINFLKLQIVITLCNLAVSKLNSDVWLVSTQIMFIAIRWAPVVLYASYIV